MEKNIKKFLRLHNASNNSVVVVSLDTIDIIDTDTTDDCKLVLKAGVKVHLALGSKMNFKITTFDDLMMLKALLKIGKSEVI